MGLKDYFLILLTVLICFLLSEAAHSKTETVARDKTLQGLAETENGKITQKNAEDFAKRNNMGYLAPAALLAGKLKFKAGDGSITFERDKTSVGYKWDLN